MKISSGSPFEKTIGFSRVIRVGSRIIVSGTAPIKEDGRTAHKNNAYLQTKRCIEIMKKAIEEAGGKIEDVVRTRIYLKNREDWEEAAKAHGEYFSTIRPASTFVVVQGFIDADWLVETEAECYCEN